MTQKTLYLCAAVVLLCAFATANVASAQEMRGVLPAPSAPVAVCPCEAAPVPCNWACSPWFAKGCPPVVTYRVGLLGHIRPVVHLPVYRPVVVRPVAVRPVVVTTRLAPAPTWYACPTYVVPSRPVYGPYCWW